MYLAPHSIFTAKTENVFQFATYSSEGNCFSGELAYTEKKNLILGYTLIFIEFLIWSGYNPFQGLY